MADPRMETWGRAFSDEELSSMQEQNTWNQFEASLFKTCQRLSAEQITPEQARLALQCIPWQAPDDRFPGESELLQRLRRLSDTGAHQEEKE